ncbi:MAG: hypothetical protein J7K26_00400, partial [Candidatus Aenigmarchaeota archaeon]|nr:hypothetical protein [Candidatus Aenigmarchaeota archaeon]
MIKLKKYKWSNKKLEELFEKLLIILIIITIIFVISATFSIIWDSSLTAERQLDLIEKEIKPSSNIDKIVSNI